MAKKTLGEISILVPASSVATIGPPAEVNDGRDGTPRSRRRRRLLGRNGAQRVEREAKLAGRAELAQTLPHKSAADSKPLSPVRHPALRQAEPQRASRTPSWKGSGGLGAKTNLSRHHHHRPPPPRCRRLLNPAPRVGGTPGPSPTAPSTPAARGNPSGFRSLRPRSDPGG